MDTIERRLNERGVPGTGVTWERIQEFAENYEKYKVETISDDALSELFLLPLSKDQTKAWARLEKWATNKSSYFILRGYAGTGKTYLLRKLAELQVDVFFTAPTNKAAKVLAKSTRREAKTTYAQLGIRMQQEEDRLILTFSDDPPYMPKNSILVVDEASMVGEELFAFIQKVVERTKCKVLFVGDPAQLPPVGEKFTKAWRATDKPDHRAFMREVMRFDNQLLTVATKIRDYLVEERYISPIKDDNDGIGSNKGVFLLKNRKVYTSYIDTLTQPDMFADIKVIAWRNKTVNAYNERIRSNFGFTRPYEVGDILMIAEPVEEAGHIVASIDDEYIVSEVLDSSISVWMDDGSKPSVDVWILQLQDAEGSKLCLNIAKEQFEVDRLLSIKADLAHNAKPNMKRKFWLDFWSAKRQFHKVRYGYAITAHRAQGSTYLEVFVDQQDIMQNSNKREAMRALYVASTRASKCLFTY